MSSLVTTAAAITRALASATPADGVSALHRLAGDLTGAAASVLLREEPELGAWRVESGAGCAAPRPGARVAHGPWIALAADARAGRAPLWIDDLGASAPELAALVGAGTGAIVACGDDRLLLIVGTSGLPLDLETAACLGDAFVVALDRARMAAALATHLDVTALMDAVISSLAIPIALPQALAVLCRGVAVLVDAERVEVWLHDRRARELVHAAASDAAAGPTPARVPTADAASVLSLALRRERASLAQADAPGAPDRLLVPLRGRRRALGVLVALGVGRHPGDAAPLLERADAIGRQASSVLENAQLLDAVLQSRGELENVFDSLIDLVVVTDARGRIVQANRPFAARVGQPRAALVDRPLEHCLDADLSAWVAGRSAPKHAAAGPARAVVTDARLGGRFDVTLTPLRALDRSPGGWVLVARDITVETRLEAERAALERRLAHSEKLLALGQFVAGVAHELNNPLQGVLGHLELLRAQPDVPAPLRRDLTLVYREADRAARIVRDLLVFAGSGRLRARPLAVNALVTRVLRLRSRAQRAARIEVARDLADGLPRVKGDGLLLQQALMNLVLNAEQAMPGPGRLAVRTGVSGGMVTIAVEDGGPGLAPEVAARVFEPFFTTKDVGEGTGLGLAIAYGVVRAHGGTIEAANIAGGGARFTIALPVTPKAHSPEPGSRPEA